MKQSIIQLFFSFEGFAAPKIVAMMTDSDVHSIRLWKQVFYVFAAVAVFGGVCFLIMGSGELEHWAKNGLEQDSEKLLEDRSKTANNYIADENEE